MSVMSAIRKDSVAGIVEQVVVGAAFFVLYGYLIRVVGAEELGVWSLVMVTVNLGQLANLGIASGLIRFVAKSEAEGDRPATIAAVETAFLITTCIFVLMGVGLVVPLEYYLINTVPETHRDLALHLLPFGILVLVLINISNVPLAALGGLQLFRWRSLLNMAGTLLGLAIVLGGAGVYGIYAATAAFVVQYVFILVAGWRVLTKRLPELSWLPRRFRKTQARELISFGLNVQIITIAFMCMEPATRLVLGLYGTLEGVTYFTLAWRFILQARSFIFAGVFVMVPAFGHFERSSPQESNPVYLKVCRMAVIVATVIFSGTIALSPFVSDVWIGRREQHFIDISIILSIGWLINNFGAVSYVRGVGEGRLGWIVWGHILMALMNIALGYGLGRYLGDDAVIWSLAASLGLSSLFYAAGTHRQFGLSLRSLVTVGDLLALALGAVASFVGYETYVNAAATLGVWPAGIIGGLATSAVLLIMIATSSQRSQIFGLVKSMLGDVLPRRKA